MCVCCGSPGVLDRITILTLNDPCRVRGLCAASLAIRRDYIGYCCVVFTIAADTIEGQFCCSFCGNGRGCFLGGVFSVKIFGSCDQCSVLLCKNGRTFAFVSVYVWVWCADNKKIDKSNRGRIYQQAPQLMHGIAPRAVGTTQVCPMVSRSVQLFTLIFVDQYLLLSVFTCLSHHAY